MTQKRPQTPQKLKGFRDYLPEVARTRRRLIERFHHHAEQAGFLTIDTPSLEYAETLLGQGGEETDKEVYQFMDHGERRVALRFDLTVPFARFVAENLNDIPVPFKKAQVGEVWRGEKPQKGRYRQFCQADVDIVGVDGIEADVEVVGLLLTVLMDVLSDVDVAVPEKARAVRLCMGHRQLLSGLLRTFMPGLTPELEPKALIALDKLAKIGNEKVATMLAEISGVAREEADKLLGFLSQMGPEGHDLTALESILGADYAADVTRYRETLALLREWFQHSPIRVIGDLSIARGLGYYTGIVFEVFFETLEGFGSICSGGRYNDLVSRFSSQHLPGVGGSIGIDRLLAAMEQLSAPTVKRRGVFIALATDDARGYAFDLVRRLRAAGFLADIAVKTGKLGNQFKFADRRVYKAVITLGSDEVKTKTFALKDMEAGTEERSIALTELVDRVGALVQRGRP